MAIHPINLANISILYHKSSRHNPTSRIALRYPRCISNLQTVSFCRHSTAKVYAYTHIHEEERKRGKRNGWRNPTERDCWRRNAESWEPPVDSAITCAVREHPKPPSGYKRGLPFLRGGTHRRSTAIGSTDVAPFPQS